MSMKLNGWGKLSIALLLICVWIIGVSETGFAENEDYPFSDLDQSAWYYAYITWAVENGIMEGYPDGSVRPDHQVTEAEFLAMLFRLGRMEAVQFNIERHGGDSWKRRVNLELENVQLPLREGEDWTANIYRTAQALYMNIKPDEEKHEALLRGEVARILVKFLSSQMLSEQHAVQYALDSELSTGKTEKSYEGYAPDDTLTRAETVAFLKRLTAPVPRPFFQ